MRSVGLLAELGDQRRPSRPAASPAARRRLRASGAPPGDVDEHDGQAVRAERVGEGRGVAHDLGRSGAPSASPTMPFCRSMTTRAVTGSSVVRVMRSPVVGPAAGSGRARVTTSRATAQPSMTSGQVVQAGGVGAVAEEGGVDRGRDHRAEVGEGAQQPGRGADPGRVGLVVERRSGWRGCSGPAGRRRAVATPTSTQIARAGADGQQQRQADDERDAADDELAADLRSPARDRRDAISAAAEHRQQQQPGRRRAQPAAVLEPLGVAVEEGVGDGRSCRICRRYVASSGTLPPSTRRSRNGLRCPQLAHHETRPRRPTASDRAGTSRRRAGFIRKSISAVSIVGEQDHAGQVEPAAPRVAGARARQPPRAEHQAGDRQRDVDGEDRCASRRRRSAGRRGSGR